MKITSARSLAIVSTLLLVAVILLAVNLFKGGRYEVKIADSSTATINKNLTDALTCTFSESSSFMKQEGNDYISHTAGMDKSGKVIAVKFTGIKDDKPRIDFGIKLRNGEEWIDELSVIRRSKEYIQLAYTSPEGTPSYYTLYPDLNVAVWQTSTVLPLSEPDRTVMSLDSMGFCH